MNNNIINKEDTLNEGNYKINNFCLHKYNGRVLVFITNKCFVNCDYCTRKRFWKKDEMIINKLALEQIGKYLVKNKEIKEIIFSGGDPLKELDALKIAMNYFSKFKQIKIFRIHSRLPIVAPELISLDFFNYLKKIKISIYLSIHINHKNELSKKTLNCLNEFLQKGVLLLAQTVFLKGINDEVKILKELFEELVFNKIRPYYIHHCDQTTGNEKYVVDIKKEIEIMSKVRMLVSGIACPLHVIDTPGGVGKITFPTNNWECNLDYYYDFENKKIDLR
jgi:lysine 2,3-aminomutase